MNLQRVLFVCVGNACRSQMAEGFARAYGKDVLTPESAGLAPAMAVPPETCQTMAEKNIDVSAHFPKSLTIFPPGHFDLVINLSGMPIREFPNASVWKVRDPIGCSADEYRAVRDQIEQLVMKLILDLRRKANSQKS
jgi:arsenate reductase